MRARCCLLVCLAWAACAVPARPSEPQGGGAAPLPVTAELRVRDTSLFAGSTFHFYIRVNGAAEVPPPRLGPADPAIQIRYIGAASATAQSEPACTFTYEALPLRAGSIALPASEVAVQGRELTIPSRLVEVAWPLATPDMQLNLSLSQAECFAGEPLSLAVSWTTALSLNGIKALDLRLPVLTDAHFAVKPPLHPADPEAPDAVGLPIANQRIIARYRDTTFRGKPAVELRFELALVPLQPTAEPLRFPPATLLCSYAEPVRAKFQGARYPSYFNNDFFDQDVTGTYQRVFVQGPALSIRIKPLPREHQPASFSGIVGPFALAAAAEPVTVVALSPVTLKLVASGYPFPQLLELPSWKRHPALERGFLVPDRPGPERGRVLADGRVEFSVPLRPRSELTAAIPALEFAFFDPESGRYQQVATSPIPLTVAPATPATVYDLQFADGSTLRNEVEPVPGGVTHNLLGSSLLVRQTPCTWTLRPWAWLLAFGLPPLVFAVLLRASQPWRRARSHPDLARREFAFRRFRRALRHLPRHSGPLAVSLLLRRYFAERFGLVSHAGEPPDLVALARGLGVEPGTAETLTRLISETDVHAFAREGSHPETVEPRRLAELVRQFEAGPGRWLLLGLAMLVVPAGLATPSRAASAAETLREASAFFDRANETAPENPAQAQGLYRLAAGRFEALVGEHGIRNGHLYYNLGNTYFLAGDLGRAIANYRRAELFLPGDLRLADALREARLRQVDEFPRAAPTRIQQNLLFWHYRFGPRERFLAIAMLYAAIWGIFAVHLFHPLAWRWKASAGLGAIILAAGVSSLLHARADPRSAGVVVQPEVLPRKGDALVYDPAFTNPLHSGAEVTILEERRDWLRVRVEDGNEGWIPAAAAERVLP